MGLKITLISVLSYLSAGSKEDDMKIFKEHTQQLHETDTFQLDMIVQDLKDLAWKWDKTGKPDLKAAAKELFYIAARY